MFALSVNVFFCFVLFCFVFFYKSNKSMFSKSCASSREYP